MSFTTHTYPGRGANGISTLGPENFKTHPSQPIDLGRGAGGRYRPKNPGPKLTIRSSRKKSRIIPKII